MAGREDDRRGEQDHARQMQQQGGPQEGQMGGQNQQQGGTGQQQQFQQGGTGQLGGGDPASHGKLGHGQDPGWRSQAPEGTSAQAPAEGAREPGTAGGSGQPGPAQPLGRQSGQLPKDRNEAGDAGGGGDRTVNFAADPMMLHASAADELGENGEDGGALREGDDADVNFAADPMMLHATTGQEAEGGTVSVYDIREHMDVIDSDGGHVGTVDSVDGQHVRLTKAGSSDGRHHEIPLSAVEAVEGDEVRLRRGVEAPR